MNDIIGLKSGIVKLCEHNAEWEIIAADIIDKLKNILGDTAVDISHVGSTSVSSIKAKPIIDIALALRNLDDITPYIPALGKNGIIFRKQNLPGQLLFIMGDLSKDIKTCYIHAVISGSSDWNNYLNFRDYLNAFPDKAREYCELKERLAVKYEFDRKSYVEGKAELITELLKEAEEWKNTL